MMPLRCILHGTDFSDHAEWAFRLACSLARDSGARLLVLHVAEAPSLGAGGVMVPPPPQPIEYHQEEIMTELRKVATSDPAVQVEHILIFGEPVDGILETARDRQCDLIVLGTHGRTGLRRLLMGSVAERVVRRAPCPVLTFRGPPGLEIEPEGESESK